MKTLGPIGPPRAVGERVKNKNYIFTTTTFRAIAEIQKSADLDSYSAAGEEKKSGRRRLKLKALKNCVASHVCVPENVNIGT